MPVEAWFVEDDEAAYILFDQDLESPGDFDNATFTIHRADRRYETGDLSLVEDNLVKVVGSNPEVTEGAEAIDYDAALEALVGANGLPVASFTGFPCPTAP